MVEVKLISVDRVRPNPLQPRESFDKEKIKELADSVREAGLLQPLVVRKKGETYQIIAGERRWRALNFLKREKIPAIVWDVKDDTDALEKSVVENLHREDLTSIERENVITHLWESGKYKTYDELGKKIGKTRGTIENIIKAKRDRERLHASQSISSRTILDTVGLPDKERKEVVKRVECGELGTHKVRDFVRTIKKSPEPIRRAIIEDSLESEIVEEVAKIERPEIQRQVLKQAKKLSSEGVRDYVKAIKEREESEPILIKEAPVGILKCPVCNKKFKVIHQEPKGHKLVEVFS